MVRSIKQILVVVVPAFVVCLVASRVYCLACDEKAHLWPSISRCRICNSRIYAWQDCESRSIKMRGTPHGVGEWIILATEVKASSLVHSGCPGLPEIEILVELE